MALAMLFLNIFLREWIVFLNLERSTSCSFTTVFNIPVLICSLFIRTNSFNHCNAVAMYLLKINNGTSL